MSYGLDEHEIKEIIQHHLNENPDLKYYMDNPYFDEFVELLLDGVSAAIEANSRQVIEDIERDISSKRRVFR